MRKLVYLIIVILILISCCPNLDTSPYKVEFQRVFLNESNRFTFIVDGIPYEVTLHYPHPVKIFYDVPPDMSMYYKTEKYCSGGSEFYRYLYIHIHSTKDLNGGGWDHGKFGHGQTSVLE